MKGKREAEDCEVPELDLIGTEYGYHCEDCFKELNYGEEVDRDGTILCKECAERPIYEAYKARIA